MILCNCSDNSKDENIVNEDKNKVNEDKNVFIVGNCEGVDNIKNLSNGLFGAISDHLLKSEKQDQDIFVDINNLKNLLDKIIYYL